MLPDAVDFEEAKDEEAPEAVRDRGWAGEDCRS